MNTKRIDGLEGLLKDFIVALLAKLDSHMGNLTLISQT